jgi:hypothetical protein
MYRLLDGDPLGIEAIAVARRDKLAYLISTDRVLLRAAAQIGFDACAYGVRGAQDEWLTKVIDKGIDGIVRDEESEHRAGSPIAPDEEVYYTAVTDLLDVSVERARGVCIAFNSLPLEAREAYFEYTRRRSDAASASPDDAGSLRADLAKALVAILSVGGAMG